jgi:hypothetical protein
MSDHDLGTQIQIILNDMYHGGRGYVNFYSHRTKESHKSIHFPFCWWEHQVCSYSKAGKSSVGFSCCLTAFLAEGWRRLEAEAKLSVSHENARSDAEVKEIDHYRA